MKNYGAYCKCAGYYIDELCVLKLEKAKALKLIRNHNLKFCRRFPILTLINPPLIVIFTVNDFLPTVSKFFHSQLQIEDKSLELVANFTKFSG